MEHGHVAPIGTFALAVTLAVGVLLVAPDARAAPAPAPQAARSSR